MRAFCCRPIFGVSFSRPYMSSGSYWNRNACYAVWPFCSRPIVALFSTRPSYGLHFIWLARERERLLRRQDLDQLPYWAICLILISCLLKPSAVECQSVLLIDLQSTLVWYCDQHLSSTLINMLIDTWSKPGRHCQHDQHPIYTRSRVGWYRVECWLTDM